MRRSLGAGLVLALIASSRTGSAEPAPAPPGVSPIHLQREDAQRLRELQRTLDREHPAVSEAPASTPLPEPTGGAPPVAYGLLAGAGVGGVVSIALLVSSGPMDSPGTYQAIGGVVLVAAAISAIAGISVLVSGKPSSKHARFELRPALTTESVGFAITGRL